VLWLKPDGREGFKAMIEIDLPNKPTIKRYRSYTDEEKAFALVALDFNQGNLHRTARELSIPRKTLAEWANGKNQSQEVAKKRQIQGSNIADKLEELVWRLVDSITDEKMSQATFLEIVRAMDICVDKMLQLRSCHYGAAHRRRGLKRHN
jgi:hypothetical protein